MDNWLVTGGAGYIGSHVVRHLLAAGMGAVVLDDLSSGDPRRVDVPLVVADVRDGARVEETIEKFKVSGVVHLAAEKQVDDSVRRPLHYFDRNVAGLVTLLTAMQRMAVDRIVFSSSAAVYGDTSAPLVDEDAPTLPINPYGETKLVGEWLVRDQARAAGLRYASLRYFNVAGAGQPELADRADNNLIPLVLRAIEDGRPPVIFGADFPTPDGTCIRDYIHVDDLARAHVTAIDLLRRDQAAYTLNVGCGTGHSVRDVVNVASEVTGRSLTPDVVGRRAGDPPWVVADTRRIVTLTPWRPRYGLRDMVASAWAARSDVSRLTG